MLNDLALSAWLDLNLQRCITYVQARYLTSIHKYAQTLLLTFSMKNTYVHVLVWTGQHGWTIKLDKQLCTQCILSTKEDDIL